MDNEDVEKNQLNIEIFDIKIDTKKLNPPQTNLLDINNDIEMVDTKPKKIIRKNLEIELVTDSVIPEEDNLKAKKDESVALSLDSNMNLYFSIIPI